MQHFLSFSVYQDLGSLGPDPWSSLSAVGCDGLELLTSFSEVPEPYRQYAGGVHLPYATDWLAAWEGRPYRFPDDGSLYYMYGRSSEDVVSNLTRALDVASSVCPPYGVLHAGNADIPEIMMRRYSRDSTSVLRAFAEMVNTVVSGMPGGEPPFKILFENLWWPGLRLSDESDFRLLDRLVEFDGWGFCLDTGHLMNTIPDLGSEEEGVDALLGIFQGYSRDMVERVETVHLHWSASGAYRRTFEERRMEGDPQDFVASAYPHISSIDQHNRFTDPRCAELLDILQPKYVTHELSGPSALDDFRLQRALLP